MQSYELRYKANQGLKAALANITNLLMGMIVTVRKLGLAVALCLIASKLSEPLV